MLVISHDRFFLNRVCTHLLVFEGDGTVRWFEGNYEEYETVRRHELGDAARGKPARPLPQTAAPLTGVRVRAMPESV